MAQKNYINNRELYNVMIQHHEQLQINENSKIPNYIGESILLICNNLIKRPNFHQYTYKEDMIADAICDCVAAINNFDPSKTENPFAYFTQIAWNACVRRILKEKKQTYIKHKNFENVFLVSNTSSEQEIVHLKNNEFSNEIIKSYEDLLTKNKNNAKLKDPERK